MHDCAFFWSDYRLATIGLREAKLAEFGRTPMGSAALQWSQTFGQFAWRYTRWIPSFTLRCRMTIGNGWRSFIGQHSGGRPRCWARIWAITFLRRQLNPTLAAPRGPAPSTVAFSQRSPIGRRNILP